MTDVEAQVRRQEAGTHADEIETSMMLYIAPGTVGVRAPPMMRPLCGVSTRLPANWASPNVSAPPSAEKR